MVSPNRTGSGNIDIMGITETGENIASINLGEEFTWFGINKKPPNHKFSGVGAVVRKEIATVTSIIQEISNHNIMWLQILTNKGAVYIAIAYCSPNSTDELVYVMENVKSNYERLSKIGKVLVMGDMNGRIGSITGDSLSNTRGKKIIKMCKETGLGVVTTDQKTKWTHYHFNKGESIIDLVMINQRDKHTVSHLFVHKNIHFGSDHRLITFNWNIWNEKIATSTEWNETPHALPNWTDQNKQSYNDLVNKTILTHRLKNINHCNNKKDCTAEGEVQYLVDILHKSLKKSKVIKHYNRQETNQIEAYNKYIDNLTNQRNLVLQKIIPGQTKCERTAITSQATKLQNMISDKIQEIENSKNKTIWEKIIEMKNKKHTSEYWKMIRKVRKETKNKHPGLIISEQQHITGKKNIANAFANTYKNVYEGKDNDAINFKKINQNNENLSSVQTTRNKIRNTISLIGRGSSPFEEQLTDITPEEINKAIKKTKKRKSPGEDEITIEAIVNGGELVQEELLIIYNNWWKSGNIPAKIQLGQIIPIFKQGDTTVTKNYRPITLLNCIFKLYEKVLETRLRTIIEKNHLIPELQKGAKSESSTLEALFTVLSALEQNESTPATIALLDLSKAYDRVWRKGLWVKLWSIGIRGKLLRAIMSTYSNPTMVVRLTNTVSDSFDMKNGLRQGSVLSPLLFVVLFSDTVKESCKHRGLPLNTSEGVEDTTSQCFVDDTILLATNPIDIIGQIDSFNYNAAIWGSVLNLNKTLILSNRSKQPITKWMEEHEIKQDQLNKTSAKYLGVWISMKNTSMKTHYKHAMDKSRRTMYFLKSRGVNKVCLSMAEVVDIIKKLILPILTYSSEVLCPSQQTINHINFFISSMISELTHIPKHVAPMSILWEANVQCFETILAKSKLRFYFKMITSKVTPMQKYLVPGNYLYEEIQSLLKNAKSEHLTPQFIKEQTELKIMTKWKWKQWVKKVGLDFNYQTVKQHSIQFVSMKPTHEICPWLPNIPVKYITSFYTARHNAWPKMICPCTQEPIQNMNIHIFNDCSHNEIMFDQLALAQHIDDMLQQKDLGHLSQVVRTQILLGKHSIHFEKENMDGVYTMAAKLCHTANKLMSIY
jgi:hypothetical protein